MLKGYKISSFKSFFRATIELKKLNLFSGANSAGKSSAIQALLIAMDNMSDGEDARYARFLHLPAFSFNELRNYLINAKSFQISITSEDYSCNLDFVPGDDSFTRTLVTQTPYEKAPAFYKSTKSVFYLPAMRTGQLHDTRINSDLNNPLGLNCEYIIDFYQNNCKEIVPEELRFFPMSNTLDSQVNYWIQKLTGYKLVVEQSNSQYKVLFETKDQKKLLPYHVGTGVSFITEVVIASLGMPSGGLLIIENPEIHLHPSAQADIIDFLAIMAQKNRQIIIESHSDHVFNGIRRLIHKRMIGIQDVAIYNFAKGDDDLTYGEQVQLDEDGRICNYIPDMFEQFDKDLDEILS